MWFNHDHSQLGERWYFLLLMIILAPINWLLEAKKWKLLINIQVPINLKQALQSILMGITFGLISPQRVGEYYGRLLLMKKAETRSLSVASTLMSSISQNLVTFVFGFVAISYSLDRFLELSEVEHIQTIWLFLIILFFLLLYFTLPFWVQVFKKIKISLIRKTIDSIALWNFQIQLAVLVYACLRYFCYGIQYVCLLHFFGADISFHLSAAGVSIIYLVQSGIPLPGGLAVLARSSVALLVLGNFELSEWTILASTWTLWVINLILPAFFGLVFIRKINLFPIK